jgi:hypothetical protein
MVKSPALSHGKQLPFRSMDMRYRVQQEDQKREGQDDKTPFAVVPLKRQKQKMPHSSDLLRVFTASG